MDPQDYTAYRYNPLAFAQDILGFQPHPHQAPLLDPSLRKVILCCTRGWGKTQIASVLAAWHLAMRPGAVVLVVSETAEKAGELVLRVTTHLARAGLALSPDPLRKNGFCVPNGSRILPLPSRSGAVRGYPATLVIVDEAAYVPDKVWIAISGTRATTSTQASVLLMSTPGARAGFFYEIWSSADPSWTRLRVPATECPHIDPAFLAQTRQEMDEDDFQREFMAEFGHSRGLLFREDAYLAAVKPTVPAFDNLTRFALSSQPWLGAHALLSNGQRVPANGFYVGVDLGQSRSHSTFAIVEYRLEPTGKADPMTLAPRYDALFRLRWLARFSLETPYTDIADTLADTIDHSELRQRSTLVIDAGGVGRGFLDVLRRRKPAASLRGVQITLGNRVTEEGGLTNIPKQDLLLALDLLLRKGKLEIAAACPELKAFRQELLAIERVRTPSGKWSYTGKTHGTDDLVLAVALAVGYACHLHPPPGLWENL